MGDQPRSPSLFISSRDSSVTRFGAAPSHPRRTEPSCEFPACECRSSLSWRRRIHSGSRYDGFNRAAWPTVALQLCDGQRCRARSTSLFRRREDLPGLDPYGTGPDRHRVCGKPIRTLLQTAQSNGIPSSQPSYGVFGWVRSHLSWLGCRGDSHLCPTPFSTHSGIKVRYLDPRAGVARCCSAGTDTRLRGHRHVHLSDPRALITSSRMSAKSLRHARQIGRAHV